MELFLERIAPIWVPHPGQRDFLLSDSKLKVLACGRRWGKTDACAAQVVASLLGERPSRHLILAPTLDQAGILFDRVADLLDRLSEHEGTDLVAIIRRHPHPRLTLGRHRLSARSGHLTRSLRGNEATDIIVDEAAYVPEELIAEVALPMLATTDGRLTLISTPRAMNHFWRFFQMGQEGRNGIWSRRAPTSETPYVPAEFLALQRELISERAYRVEYEAEFLDAAGRVFRTEAVDACLGVPRDPGLEERFAIGVDWAMFEDYTAFAAVQGTRRHAELLEIDRFHQIGWEAQASRVADFINRFPSAKVHGDANSIGGPMLDRVQSLVRHVAIKRFYFGPETKASLIENLAWMIETASLRLPAHPELLRELHHFETSGTARGNLRYGGVSGYHDDLVIALALACWGLESPGGSHRAQVAGNRR